MANWKYNLKIRQFIDTETYAPSNEAGVEAATNVLNEFKKFRENHAELNEDARYELDEIEDVLKEAIESSNAVDDFNFALDVLYDFADANLVWVE